MNASKVKQLVKGLILKERELRLLKRRFPEILTLEVTTRCNANCVYCGRPKENRDMDLDLFKALVDAAPFVKTIYASTRGEPLLYPHLLEAIDYCKAKEKRVEFYTNGSLLDLDYAKRLLDSRVDRVRFSIDDCDPERFNEKRKGLGLSTIIKNLRRFLALRNAAKSKTLIDVRATLTDTNRDHQQEIRDYFAFADGFAFVSEFGVTRDLPLRSWSYDRPLFCNDPFTTLAVRWNGQAVLCCNDWEDNFPIGRKLTQSVTEFDIQRVFSQVRVVGVCMTKGDLPTICVNCRNRWRG